ncbi:MAG: surface carbohydrate biosynthesis protein [Prosthecobacter sp.]|nr:surface carbohydrate biosynthesis protein [Prosthecobacter sp.]
MSERSAVLLVDHRNRDLMGSALLAHHLEARGVRTHLESLECYHSCLAAHAPDLILFNHINSSHLVKFSRRLKELNVLTAVLPNEGILYHEEVLRYNSGRFHKGSHMDFYFCWNETHQRALREEGPGGPDTRIEVCGVPRFDFYLEPWKRILNVQPKAPGARPRLVLCTNLAMARYQGLADNDAAQFFAPFRRVPMYDDYKYLINYHVRFREKLMEFLKALAASGKFDIILRPHPREVPGFYLERMAAWETPVRERVTVDHTSNITELILSSDLEISCETCTTAMEAWIAGKPAVELVFERHPVFFHEDQANLNVLCDDPATVVETVSEQLRNPEQAAMREGRNRHLAKWCSSPDGRATERLAEKLAAAIHAKGPVKRDFTFTDRRKAAKMKLLQRFDLAYNFDPFLWLKRRILPKNYATKRFVYEKTIRPSDVSWARARVQEATKSEGTVR